MAVEGARHQAAEADGGGHRHPFPIFAGTTGAFPQLKPNQGPSTGDVRAAILADEETVPGVHDLRPVGPRVPEGLGVVRNGTLGGLWTCSRCNLQASDTSNVCTQADW